MIGRSGERGSGISVLAARHDDDDDLRYFYDNDLHKETIFHYPYITKNEPHQPDCFSFMTCCSLVNSLNANSPEIECTLRSNRFRLLYPQLKDGRNSASLPTYLTTAHTSLMTPRNIHRWGGLAPLLRNSRCILPPHPIWQ